MSAWHRGATGDGVRRRQDHGRPEAPDANVCWCLSYRIPSKENQALSGTARGRKVAALMRHGPPGVLAYQGDEVVGWAAVHPRADTSFATTAGSRTWTISTCGRCGASACGPGTAARGSRTRWSKGAVEFARAAGAPAIEAYPVDNKGKKVDLTMAYVGTRALFEKAGFTKAADTDSVLNGFPRVLMRLDLR